MGDASNHYGTDDCLDDPHGCTGEVFHRRALSGSGEHYTELRRALGGLLRAHGTADDRDPLPLPEHRAGSLQLHGGR